MNRDRRDPALPRFVFGLAVLATGIVFWLDRMDIVDRRDYLRWWPLALVAMGLSHLPYRRWFTAAFWTAAGTFFLLPLLGLRRVSFWRIIGLWPLMISAGGVALILQALRRREADASLRAIAVMGGNVQKVGAQFRGGEAVAVMGGCNLDFATATIAGEATLDVLAFWGGIAIFVPEGWAVIRNVTPILGGYDDNTGQALAGAPRLILRGAVIGGGIDVRNSKESVD